MTPLRTNETLAARRLWLAVASVAFVLALAVAVHHVDLHHGSPAAETMFCLAVVGAVGAAAALGTPSAPRARFAIQIETAQATVLPAAVRPSDRPRDGPPRLQVFLS